MEENNVTAQNTAPPPKKVESFFQAFCTGLPIGAETPSRPVKQHIAMSPLRKWIAPFLLIVGTPIIALGVWIIAYYYEGSLTRFAQDGLYRWIPLIPRPSGKAVLVIFIWLVAQWLLLRFLPGKTIKGPITAKGNRPTYKMNGILAWIISHGTLFGVLYPLGIVDPARLFHIYGSVIITLNIGALLYCLLLYIKGHLYPSSSDTVYTGNFLFDFFQGIELYPMFAGTSLKQLINCRVSMMGWSTVFISFSLAQYEEYGFIANSMMVSVAVLVLYLFKFFVWEKGYLHSLDIMHDRFGYYICWGVLVWVPSVYCLVAMFLVYHPITLHPLLALAYLAIGVASIWINYSADNQRRRVRDSNGKAKIWGKEPSLIVANYTTTGGQAHTNLLLASGWWGLARHFHYVPELVLAAMWTIPVGFTHALPWFYCIFLFILLMDRANRDEKRCAAKYGKDWDSYKEKVKYKVFPGIF